MPSSMKKIQKGLVAEKVSCSYHYVSYGEGMVGKNALF